MAVPYEKSIETLEDVLLRTDRAHFCGGDNEAETKILLISLIQYIIGGTYESSFSQATSPIRKKIYELGKKKSTRPGVNKVKPKGWFKCSLQIN